MSKALAFGLRLSGARASNSLVLSVQKFRVLRAQRF